MHTKAHFVRVLLVNEFSELYPNECARYRICDYSVISRIIRLNRIVPVIESSLNILRARNSNSRIEGVVCVI